MKFLAVLTVVTSLSAFGAGRVDGGVSGGGGNLISPTPPTSVQDPREIRHIIKGSRDLLKNFIEAKYALYQSGSMDYESIKLYSVLFNNDEDDLHEIVEDISMDVPLDKPCYDDKGNEFDGSTFGQRAHSICISAYNIAKKCDRSEVPRQATALVFHEFSEKAGLSDDDAINLQKQVLEELKAW